MKTQTTRTIPKITVCFALIALLVMPLVTLSASAQDKSVISANGADVRTALTADEAREAALAAAKEKAAAEAARFAPTTVPAAILRQARPAAPNGGHTFATTACDMGPTGYTTLASVFDAINA